jgi:dihydroceramidase
MYWGEKDTSISFCEDAYKESNYIAEYYNTLTGISYILVSIPFLNTNINKLAIMGIVLGNGTIILHMTQRYYGQILDEGTMLILSYGILTNLNKRYNPKYATFLILIYLKFYDNFKVFFTMFSFIIMCIVKETQNERKPEKRVLRNIFLTTQSLGLICWSGDQLLCDYTADYYLHGWWHILTSISLLIGFIMLKV